MKLYAAVAQVLTYIFQLKKWHPSRGPMPQLVQVDVGADGAPSIEFLNETGAVVRRITQ